MAVYCFTGTNSFNSKSSSCRSNRKPLLLIGVDVANFTPKQIFGIFHRVPFKIIDKRMATNSARSHYEARNFTQFNTRML